MTAVCIEIVNKCFPRKASPLCVRSVFYMPRLIINVAPVEIYSNSIFISHISTPVLVNTNKISR